LVSRTRLTDEGKTATERVRQRYVEDDDVHAPSVITLNAVAASLAVNEWMIRAVGLAQRDLKPDWVFVDSLTGQWWAEETTKNPDCRWCGSGRAGVGDARRLPVKGT
jgi:hypothetical protein